MSPANASVNDAACGFVGRISLIRNGIPVPRSKAKAEQRQLVPRQTVGDCTAAAARILDGRARLR